jgi:hypothetical protein
LGKLLATMPVNESGVYFQTENVNYCYFMPWSMEYDRTFIYTIPQLLDQDRLISAFNYLKSICH